jgi:hypothetical protein
MVPPSSGERRPRACSDGCAARGLACRASLLKFSLFVVVGLLSLIPTMEFPSWRGVILAAQIGLMLC